MIKEVLIELSQNCNLDCVFCGFGSSNNDKDKFMNNDDLNKVLMQLPTDIEKIRLNGRGESTIHPNFIEIVESISSRFPNTKLSLFTNLNYNDIKISECLVKNNFELYISLDSTNKEKVERLRKGLSFDTFMSNLESIKNIDMKFLCFTLQEDNIDEIRNIGEFCLVNGLNLILNVIRRDSSLEYFKEQVVKNKDNIKESFDYLNGKFGRLGLTLYAPDQIAGIRIYESSSTSTMGSKSSCLAIDRELVIYYDGSVGPCNMFNPYHYGNIFKSTLHEILGSKERKDFINNHKKHYYCENCAMLIGGE